MVVKQMLVITGFCSKFESSVISYGSQTIKTSITRARGFESSVISYGSQTSCVTKAWPLAFESSVISYGSQTALIAEEAAS